MLNEITKVNFDTIREAAAAGESITAIINGQYYDLDTEAAAAADPNEAFIEGIRFAAAVLTDRRARQNNIFEGMKTIKKVSKAATEANSTRNDEIKGACDFIEYLITCQALPVWYEEYKNNKLWKL